MCESGDWFLLHDNAPSHNATIVKQFLAQQKVTVLDHPPYSPNLEPADYFLFQKVKSHLKGPLWLDFGHPESRDKYIKHHCKGRLLQRHPEAVWPCKSVCTVRGDECRKLNNKIVIYFKQILFIMSVLKLSRRIVFNLGSTWSLNVLFKSNPITDLDRPWGFQEVQAPRFQDNRHMKVVRLSALGTGRLYP